MKKVQYLLRNNYTRLVGPAKLKKLFAQKIHDFI